MNVDRNQFERCWPWLCASIEHYGHTHEKEDLWAILEEGRASLYPLPHGAIVASIEVHPTGLKECYGWLAGGDLHEIARAEPLIARAMKEMGCQRVALRARPGWVRALEGYKNYGSLLVKDL